MRLVSEDKQTQVSTFFCLVLLNIAVTFPEFSSCNTVSVALDGVFRFFLRLFPFSEQADRFPCFYFTTSLCLSVSHAFSGFLNTVKIPFCLRVFACIFPEKVHTWYFPSPMWCASFCFPENPVKYGFVIGHSGDGNECRVCFPVPQFMPLTDS